MKQWICPSLIILNNEQLKAKIYAVANSDCIRRHVR